MAFSCAGFAQDDDPCVQTMDKNVEKFKGYPKPFSEIQEDPYYA